MPLLAYDNVYYVCVKRQMANDDDDDNDGGGGGNCEDDDWKSFTNDTKGVFEFDLIVRLVCANGVVIVVDALSMMLFSEFSL